MKKVGIDLRLIGVIFILLLCPGLLIAGTAPSLEVLTPKKGEEVSYESDVVIAISIYDPEGDTDTTSVEMKVDNKEVTQKANISALLVTYAIENIKVIGKHTFSFEIKDKEGNESTVTSFFTVAPKPVAARVFSAHGSVKVGGEYDDQATPSTVGTANIYVYGTAFNAIDYTASVDLTSVDLSPEGSTDGQRVSRFRLDLYTPVGGLVLGDTTPSFSSYSINGMRVFGVHALPQFAIFGLEFVYGQSLSGVRDPATQQQTVLGGRLKIGKEPGFLWGLSLLKVRDEVYTPINANPQDNLVIGTDVSLSILNGRLVFTAEANESLLNTDITDGPQEFGGFPTESLAWLFIINEHMLPISVGLPNLAAKAGIKLGPFFENTLNAEFSYIGPSYYSLGNTAITNDKMGLRAWDTIWLLNKRLYLNLGYQYYWNNLENTLSYTTNTMGFSGSAYVYPSDYLSINAGADVLTTYDTGRSNIDTVNTTIDGGVSYDFEILDTSSTGYFNGTASFLSDIITPANDQGDYSTRLGVISYFNAIPLDTKAVVGYDFGTSPNSIYLEGGAGYWFFPGETLYAYINANYATGDQLLELKIGSTLEAIWDTEIEATLEYLTSPDSSNMRISAFATKEF